MDNQGISLFQGTDIQINNSKNVEEEEDLEDQLRRKEELQNLLQANLDDFKYDESTINSSANVSLVSADNLEQLYKDAISPSEQLKVLYDVRCREIHSLKEEFEKFKTEKASEIKSQKQQNLLFETEIRQLSISLKNAENLLVDKTETINALGLKLHDRDTQISKLEKLVKEYEDDLVTYKSEVSELHLKLQSQSGPFNLNAKYNSEELRNSLQGKIEKLESSLEEATQKFEICNAEKQVLQKEVERLALDKIDLEKDNRTILKNLDSAQQQCKDLIDVIEVLKHENDHFKERLNEVETAKLENTSSSHRKSDVGSSQSERLKKMLVDKSVELDSLKTKLRYYECDLKELTEYRQLKCDIYKKEFQKCDNKNHTKELLLMQNEFQNYRRVIEDKNQQILSLNSNTKDLKEKIEEMLLQTRNDIQNISSKYNMPQLEVMRKELEKAEYTEKILSRKLEESEERRLSLIQKLNSKNHPKEALMEELANCREVLKNTEIMLANEQTHNMETLKEIEYKKTEILQLKNELEELKVQLRKSPIGKTDSFNEEISENDYRAIRMQLKKAMEHLEKNCNSKSVQKDYPELVAEIKMQMDNFLEKVEKETIEKGLVEEQISSWKKLLDEVEIKDADEILKSQYKEAVINLHASEEKLKDLEEALQDLQNTVTIAEGEKCGLSVELKEYSKKLQYSENIRKRLESEIERLKALVKKSDDELANLKLPEKMNGINNKKDANNALDDLQKELKRLNEQLNEKESELVGSLQVIKRYEQEKKETRKWLDKMKKEIDRLNDENIKLNKELHEAQQTKNGIESVENTEIEQNVENENDFRTRLEEEVMKCELKLRDDLQIEYQKRISDIEKRYQKTFKETTELCKQQKLKLEEQDKQFREYLKTILTECESCTTKLENEKFELAGQLQLLRNDYEKYKVTMDAQKEKYCDMLKKKERESQKMNEAWKAWSKKVVCSCLDIEATNKKVRDRVLTSMERYDKEVSAIQKLADTKAERKSLKKKKLESVVTAS